ncbi:MAG: class I SAM-dependent methyltransferase [Candidatus Andersenbacteria bacterium]
MTHTNKVGRVMERFEQLYQRGITPWTEHGMEPEIPALADLLLERIAEPVLLDIGCGNGWTSIYFAKRGIAVKGIDSSPTAIVAAQEKAKRARLEQVIHFEVGDGLALPYVSSTFDAVFDRGFFHHVPIQQYEQYIFEVSRVLTSKGLLSLHAFTPRTGVGEYRFERDDIERIFGEHFVILQESYDPWPTDAPAHLGHYLLERRI